MLSADLDDIMQIESTIYSHPWTRGKFSDSLKSGYDAMVMTLNDEVVGYALMMLVLDESHLLNVSIAKAHQAQGLGHLLLSHMVMRAKNADASHMFLEVRSSNVPAIGLYEKMGFVTNTVRRGYYPIAGGREDAVLMSLII